MSETIDWLNIDRPVEPYSENENPEQWCMVLAWEEAQNTALRARVKELEEAIEPMIDYAQEYLDIENERWGTFRKERRAIVERNINNARKALKGGE